jgi:hypothetical protein
MLASWAVGLGHGRVGVLGPRVLAVRVLRVGLDRGLAGPGDVAGPTAAAGDDDRSYGHSWLVSRPRTGSRPFVQWRSRRPHQCRGDLSSVRHLGDAFRQILAVDENDVAAGLAYDRGRVIPPHDVDGPVPAVPGHAPPPFGMRYLKHLLRQQQTAPGYVIEIL